MLNKLHNKKLSTYCLLFCASILSIFTAFEGNFTVQSIIPVITITLLFFLISKEKKILLSKQTKILLLLNIVYALSLFINSFRYNIKIYSIIQMIYQLILLIWFYLITHKEFSKVELRQICKTIVYVSFICGIYIFIQNIIFNNRIFAITTLFNKTIDKNHFSTWISLSVTLSFYFLIYSNKKLKYIVIFSMLVLSEIFMNSRGAIVSSLICCLLIFFYYIFSNGISFKKITIVFCIFASILFLFKVAKDIMPEWLYNRYFVNSYVDGSNTDRIYRWLNAFDGLKTHPILGFGPGVFSTLHEYQVTDFGKQISTSTPSHNTFIDIALNGGLIALILFLYFLYSIVIDFFKKYRLYIPIVVHLFINAMILGASKTVYFWTIVIFLTMLLNYLNKSRDFNIFID